MSHTLFMAFAGMRSRSRALDMAASNLANLGSAGFKKDIGGFQIGSAPQELTRDQLALQINAPLVRLQSRIDFSPGDLVTTGRPLDLALAGDGFFEVLTERGIRYTRNGSFSIDGQGRLVTSAGHPVLGEGKTPRPLVLGPGAVTVSASGDVSVDDNLAGRLRIVSFRKPEALQKLGGGLFDAGEAEAEPPRNLRLEQGVLESSNLRPGEAMADLIKMMRGFEMMARAIRSLQEDVDGKLIDEIARIR